MRIIGMILACLLLSSAPSAAQKDSMWVDSGLIHIEKPQKIPAQAYYDEIKALCRRSVPEENPQRVCLAEASAYESSLRKVFFALKEWDTLIGAGKMESDPAFQNSRQKVSSAIEAAARLWWALSDKYPEISSFLRNESERTFPVKK